MSKKVKNLMSLDIPQLEAEKILNKQIERGKKLLKLSMNNLTLWKIAEKKYSIWNSANFDILKKIFEYKNIAADYTKTSWYVGDIFLTNLVLCEKIEKLQLNIKQKIAKLESILNSLQILQLDKNAENVFFVHGRDSDIADKVLAFLNEIGLHPIILKHLAAAGKTIIEEIQQHPNVKFAIGLFTPDEMGGKDIQNMKLRADQNVVLELGIFVGKLGRKNVSSLYLKSVELPQDYHDFQHILLDDKNRWQKLLKKELQTAGLKLQ